MQIPTPAQIDRELVRRGGLHAFVRLAWDQVESAPFVDNWHIKTKCDVLEAVTRGEIKRLIINEPPGCTKSLIVCVFWPVWTWIQTPAFKWVFASFDSNLTRRDSNRSINLVQSKWFRERWPHLQLTSGRKPQRSELREPGRVAVSQHYTSKGGMRLATSIPLGRLTGNHGDAIVIDDPTKPMAALGGSMVVSGNALAAVREWWANTTTTRGADPKNLRKVIIMQRLHEADLSGHVLSGDEQWEHVRFPMRYEQGDPCKYDPRTEQGELLWPERFSEEVVKSLEENLGPSASAAQLQQRPSPKGGDIFTEDLFRYYSTLPDMAYFVQSWDLTFKKSGTSRVAGDLWGVRDGKCYLVDWITPKRMSFPETYQCVKARATGKKDYRARSRLETWPTCRKILIEDKANGPATIDTLRAEGIRNIQPITPIGTKEERANASLWMFEKGRVLHPDPSFDSRIQTREASLKSFPRGAEDDEVDTTTMAVLYLAPKRPNIIDAMAKV